MCTPCRSALPDLLALGFRAATAFLARQGDSGRETNPLGEHDRSDYFEARRGRCHRVRRAYWPTERTSAASPRGRKPFGSTPALSADLNAGRVVQTARSVACQTTRPLEARRLSASSAR